MIDTSNQTPSTRPLGRPTKPIHLNVDVPLVLTLFTLLSFGILMVYSASWDFSLAVYGSHTKIFTRQINWLLIGLAAALFTTWMDYHYWRKIAVPAMMVVVVGLIAVFIIGEVRLGSARTLFNGSYMPSEAAKFVTIIYLSIWMYSKRNQLSDINFGLLPLGAIIGVISGLIMAQPDLSAAATIIFLGGMLFFLAGGDLKQIFVLLVFTVLVGWVVVQVHPTGSTRIANYLSGLKDPNDADYHVRRSIESFVKGGFFGVGIGKAETKLTGLPVPPTDSIFAVVAEETGIFGTSILVMLYGMIVWRGILTALRAPDILGSLMAAGLTMWVAVEAGINMAVMVGLMPFAGNTLPFISAGGSSLVANLAAMGVILNIGRNSKKSQNNSERKEYAVDGVRRRNRRGRVSRPRSSSGSW